jgi:dTDP-glucose 4,6-dehydratase
MRHLIFGGNGFVGRHLAAVNAGLPNAEFNLGSLNPPTVRDLLGSVIGSTGSRSVLTSTPAPPATAAMGLISGRGMPHPEAEQFLPADRTCLLDVSRAQHELGWRPAYTDTDMLASAYQDHRSVTPPVPDRHATVVRGDAS